MRKKILALLLTVAMICSMCVVPALAAGETPSVTFADAKGTWAESSINRWASAGIIAGDPDGKVNPSRHLTRAELATILVRFLGLSETAGANTFSDVSADDWFAGAILKCAAAGIMQGWAGKADPNDPITREQAITMVGRALGVKAKAGQDLSQFSDADQVFPYAVEYMAPLTAMGILKGVEDGSKVAPKAYIDRASALALLDKAIAAYVTTPGSVKAEDADRFIIVNASAGDVTISGTAAGVLVTNGNKADVKLNGLKADTVKVDSAVTVDVMGSAELGSMDVNAPATVNVARGSKVGTLDTADAPSAVINQSTGSTGGGGGGGGGSRPTSKTYAITVDTAIANGTVRASRASASKGAIITLTVEAAEGYELDTLTVTGTDGTVVSVNDSKFTMPDQAVTVTATFQKIGGEGTYAITVDTTVNGTVTADKETAKAGETVTLTVTAVEGYELDTLTVDGVAVTVTNGTYVFTMPAKAVVVSATFKAVKPVDPEDPDVYAITVDATVNGAVTADRESAKAGETVTLTIIPATGYELDVLRVNGQAMSVTGGKCVFTMPAQAVVVRATFKAVKPVDPDRPDVYAITVDAAIVNGVVTTSPAGQAEAGTVVTVTATPAQGYELKTLTVNGQAVVNGQFTMPAQAVTVSATFEKKTEPEQPTKTYTVTNATAADANGTLELSKTSVEEGESVTVTVKPAQGYELDTLTVNGTAVSVTGNTYTLTVTADVTVKATFKAAAVVPENVTITLALAGNAADAVQSVALPGIAGANGVYTVEKDTEVTIVVTLKDGKSADAYTVSADTVTFTANGSAFTGKAKAAATATITITVAKKETPANDAGTRKAD